MIIKYIFLTIALMVLRDVSATKFDVKTLLRNLRDTSNLKASDRCTEEGAFCLDCNTSIYCIKLPTGEFLEDITNCNDDEYCSLTDGVCGDAPNKYCEDLNSIYKYECHQTGMYPHPYDCTKYFMCLANSEGAVVLDPIELKCNKNGYAYDSYTTLCSRKKDNYACEPIIGDCQGVGTQGPVVNNTYMFYVCLNTDVGGERLILPQLFHCEDGEIYVENTCRDPSKPPTGLDENNQCTMNGDFHVSDCRKYNKCVQGRAPVLEDCAPDRYFDGWANECVPMKC